MNNILEDKLDTLTESATTSLNALTEWLKTKGLYNSDIKDFELTFDDFIDEIETPDPTSSILRDDYSDIDDVFNDNFDISNQLDKVFYKLEEEQGEKIAEEHIQSLSDEYSALKSQFLAHLVELQEFMLVITEDLN